MDPVETNRYLRVNRDELVSDTNMSVAGSVVSQNPITNPVQTDSGAYLLSRVGGSDRWPTPGYCLHFDSTNPDVYIQTLIPSSSVSDWNIIIKGSGTSDFISTDSTGTNIAFRLNATLGSTDYYDLSYIAFLNNETGKIDHLFECEENGGLLLYDAVTGDIATITSDTSLSTLRGSSSTKEYIKNIDDAINGVSCYGTWCNAVGYNENNGINIPRKVLN